jgi:hypothetical protein
MRRRRPDQLTGEDGGSLFDAAGRRWSSFLAQRFDRRSFIAQMGKGGVALAVGSTVAALDAPLATAHTNPCGQPNSVTCNTIIGQNQCPAGSCSCGYWDCYAPPCPSGLTRWHDCCGGCDSGCYCINDHPICCNHRAYTQGCLSGQSPHIKCRHYSCPYG